MYSGATIFGDVQKKKKGERGGWAAVCKAKVKRWRGSSGKYAKLEECESEKEARREAKRERKQQRRKERREWLLETGSDFNYGYGGVYGMSVGGAIDWRLCMGVIF